MYDVLFACLWQLLSIWDRRGSDLVSTRFDHFGISAHCSTLSTRKRFLNRFQRNCHLFCFLLLREFFIDMSLFWMRPLAKQWNRLEVFPILFDWLLFWKRSTHRQDGTYSKVYPILAYLNCSWKLRIHLLDMLLCVCVCVCSVPVLMSTISRLLC